VGSKLLVVALEQAVAAPLCTRRLADLGARIVKVERTEGDFARRYDRVAAGQSSYFVWLNRGKESICLDLRSDTDLEVLESMVLCADVFVENLRPGTLADLGIDLSLWRTRNTGLITCCISGFGESGPLATRKAYDLLIQAESGLAAITGSPLEPSRVGISIVDIAAGVTAYEAILEALLRRASTGAGDHVEVSLFDAICEWMTVPLLHAKYGRAPKRVGLMHPSIAPYGAFECADHTRLLIAIQNDREWVTFCAQVLQRGDLLADPRFRDNVSRVENRSTLDAEVGSSLAQLSSEDARRRLDAGDVAYGLINELDEVLKHPNLRMIEIETPNGPVVMPAPAARHASGFATIGRVPDVDEHGPSIRAEFSRRNVTPK
jgi:itaconate CoA-transferase